MPGSNDSSSAAISPSVLAVPSSRNAGTVRAFIATAKYRITYCRTTRLGNSRTVYSCPLMLTGRASL